MELANCIACICEGTAEKVVMELLLNHDLLIFKWENLLEQDLISERNAKKFEEKYLRKSFHEKITILRILDSRRERFKLSPAYEGKIDVINIITAPEIEMLIILTEQKYTQYKVSNKKPSLFCAENLRMHNVKSRKFLEAYFKDVNVLIYAIKEYQRISNIQRGEYTLYDLLAKGAGK